MYIVYIVDHIIISTRIPKKQIVNCKKLVYRNKQIVGCKDSDNK